VHGGNSVEAILYFIFISSNLFQLFRLRRIKNHISIQKELVRLLLKGLYLLKHDNELIFRVDKKNYNITMKKKLGVRGTLFI